MAAYDWKPALLCLLCLVLGCAGQSSGPAATPDEINTFLASLDPPLLEFLPLTEDALTLPGSDSTVETNAAEFAADPHFGRVMTCQQDGLDSALITGPSAAYGATGGLAINLWMKTTDPAGDSLQFLYSHDEGNTTVNAGSPNQVHLYVPERGHPRHGVLRAILKDADDTFEGRGSEVFLDSNGQIGVAQAEVDPAGLSVNPADGSWHMATLTTLPGGDPGYQLYVDGLLAAELTEAVAEVTSAQSPGSAPARVALDGGDPLRLAEAPIILCGRSDLDRSRHFSGSVTQLSLWDGPLDAEQVWDIYDLTAPPEMDRDPDVRLFDPATLDRFGQKAAAAAAAAAGPAPMVEPIVVTPLTAVLPPGPADAGMDP